MSCSKLSHIKIGLAIIGSIDKDMKSTLDDELTCHRCENHKLRIWFGAGNNRPLSHSPRNRWWLLYQSNPTKDPRIWDWVEEDVGFASLEEAVIWCELRGYSLPEVVKYS